MSQHEPKKIRQLLRQLKNEKLEKFPKKKGERINAPTQQGVYVIYSPTDLVLHVGSTPRGRKGIAQRLRNHLQAQSSFSKTYLEGKGSRLRRGYKFCFLVVGNARHRALLEALAIGDLCPKHIGVGRTALAERSK